MALMGETAEQFRRATKRLRELEATKTIRVAQVEVILLSRKIDLLKSEGLKKHLNLCFADPKFRWTNEVLSAFMMVELRELLGEYNYYEKVARNAEKENEMWSKQLMYYQSKNKLKGAELRTLS